MIECRRISIFSWSASSWALRSGRTLKPMITAFEAEASSTSFSLMAPTPLCRILIFTLSLESLVRVSASTSAEPCTSAFKIMGSSLVPAVLICSASPSSESLELLASVASRARCSRYSAICRAFSRSATINTSPDCGNPSRPSTSTGVDGGASSTARLRSSNMARTLPKTLPTMKLSPTRNVPFCTSTVATMPRPRSTLASTTVPVAGRSGLAFRS